MFLLSEKTPCYPQLSFGAIFSLPHCVCLGYFEQYQSSVSSVSDRWPIQNHFSSDCLPLMLRFRFRFIHILVTDVTWIGPKKNKLCYLGNFSFYTIYKCKKIYQIKIIFEPWKSLNLMCIVWFNFHLKFFFSVNFQMI